MIDYEKLKEFLREEIQSELRLMNKYKNINSPGYCMSLGAHEAYVQVMKYINGDLDD